MIQGFLLLQGGLEDDILELMLEEEDRIRVGQEFILVEGVAYQMGLQPLSLLLNHGFYLARGLVLEHIY